MALELIKNTASKNLQYIISQAASRTPNVGEKAVISIKNFTLNSFIPKKSPLYSYEATLPYAPCNGTHQYVVFMPDCMAVVGSCCQYIKLILETGATLIFLFSLYR